MREEDVREFGEGGLGAFDLKGDHIRKLVVVITLRSVMINTLGEPGATVGARQAAAPAGLRGLPDADSPAGVACSRARLEHEPAVRAGTGPSRALRSSSGRGTEARWADAALPETRTRGRGPAGR
ncbi:hypothetical protein GCM10010392_51770 [Streptomyces clavifer]|nr:hypothetical protein GCM10010392_51770 [Streptomyces clavifer]